MTSHPTDRPVGSQTSGDPLFSGPTEMHGRCRSHDWSATALGPVEGWPDALRAAVQICLDAPTPMTVWAGPDLLLIYNDAYRAILGPERHPAALGRPAPEVWAKHWAWLAPEVALVMTEGRAVHRDGKRLYLGASGAAPSYFTYTFTPIRGVDGGVIGVFKSIQEITASTRDANELRRIVERAPDLLAVADTRGWFRRVNPAFTRVLGWTEEQMLARPIGFFVHPDDQRRTEEEIAGLAMGRPTEAFENRYRHVDGSYRWLSWTAWKDAVDERIYATARDVTESKKGREAVARAHALLEGITEGTEDMIATIDLDFRFTYFNDAFRRENARVWGAEPALGADIPELLTPWPTQKRFALEAWGRALAGETFRIETPFGPSARRNAIYDIRFSPVRDDDGEIIGAAEIMRDVTERVRLTEALGARERALREADRRKDEFLAMLGHELRNPLSAILGATELLQLADGDADVVGRATDCLARQTSRMVRLVDGLLEVSRVARGKIALEREILDLREVLESVATDRRRQIAERRLELRLNLPSEPVWVSGDAVRLLQVADNLLGNAVKFTDPGGIITLSLWREAERAVFCVRDTGVGIRQPLLERIFEPFQQEAQDAARSRGGLGLGLALSRRLTELHGGRLSVKSEGLGKGAEFRMVLPLAAAPAETTAATGAGRAAEPVARARPRRLLLVEDDPDASRMMTMLLRRKGHEVTAVADGPAALGALGEREVDLVLCDLGLPGMSGYEFARAARADASLRDLPMVAVTGYGQPDDKRRAADAGFDAHLTKPVDIERLDEVLRQLG